MQVEPVETKGAAQAFWQAAGAAESLSHKSAYHDSVRVSRSPSLQQAGEVLTLLAFFPLNGLQWQGFMALIHRRLQRAYRGHTRERTRGSIAHTLV